MGFTSVRIANFRNLKPQYLDLSAPVIYLTGENGQGKTNFLEVLYFLCYASSFRTRNDKTLIQNGSNSFQLHGIFKQDSDGIPGTLDVFLNKDKKKIHLNGKNVDDRKDILSNMPCIVFCHNDLYFVIGNPEKKRNYLDQCLSLYSSLYINELRQYKKILRERNCILKKSDTELLPVYSQQLLDIGLSIQEKRHSLISYLNQSFSRYYNKVTNTNLDLKIHYDKSWKENTPELIMESMRNREKKELLYGLTLSGPHRDSFSIIQDGKMFTDYASTGQIRIISLILRILQSEYYQLATSRKPVLLVDDVLLELDSNKRERMMQLFPSHEQIFYTFLPGYTGNSDQLALEYRVTEGLLEKVNGKSK